MNNTNYLKLLAFLATTFLLFGCSEDGALSAADGVTTDGTTDPASSTLRVGSGSGSSFSEGSLEIKNIAVVANGSTDVSVFIVDDNGNLSTGTNSVTFTSHCDIQGLASFTSTNVTTTTGIATTTYLDQGCQTSDTIIATADWDTNLTANGDITIDSSVPATANTLRIGTGTSAAFVQGDINVTTPNIASDGSTLVSVNLVDANGDLLTSVNSVTFTSDCEQAGKANFTTPGAFVTTSTGTATTTYNASGCVAADTISATITVGTTDKVATGIVTVASASAGSIQFTSVTNSLIALQGTGNTTGLSENTSITFTVMDANGAPVANEPVTFALNSTTGGITLSFYNSTSSANGEVTTTLQSGTVATTVSVSATIDSNTTLTSDSDTIAISTGPADQNSMSLSASEFNPRAWNVDGKEVTITARLADRYNNPIQDGTAVLFTTELGAIQSTCTTVGGACSVNWISQDPRGDFGRNTILAHVEGEESFVDVNANGIFDTGDTFTDLAEAYQDENENGVYDSGEVFVDFNGNNTWDAGDGLYNGSSCANNCSPTSSVSVRDSLVLIMAEDTPAILAMGTNGLTDNLCSDFASCIAYRYSGPIFSTDTVNNVRVTLGGIQNEQVLPVGTSIRFVTTNGEILGGETNTVTNTTAYGTFDVSIGPDADDIPTGALSVTVKIADGGTEFDLPIAAIDDSGAPVVTSLRVGSGSGTSFVAEELEIKVPGIEEGGSTEVSAYIVDPSEILDTASHDITFSSHCSLMGRASFSATNVNTTTGIATTTYTAGAGCTVDDTIIASADWDSFLGATGLVTISPSAVVLRIGTGTGAGFTESAVNVTTPSIAADGSTAVSVNLVDIFGALLTTSQTVTFSSVCEQDGTANFSNTSVTTGTGTASTTYNATGCSGTDIITATVTVDGTDKTATGVVTVASAPASSIQFDSATETLIALQGAGSTTGLPENSTLTFIILDSNGSPVANENVTFSMDNILDGITLSNLTATSNVDGLVTTVVQSGPIATNVSVSVVVDANLALTTTSSSIVIATGPPDQDSMSLSISSLNPRAWNNTTHVATATVTAHLADRYNSPVQDGTAILFTTELGSIDASCSTEGGSCSVEWRNSGDLGSTANAGRNTILATVVGDESFTDQNSNGMYDNGEPFDDLGEAYLDENENNIHDATEPFTDFTGGTAGVWDGPDGTYNGSSCATGCSATASITVRSSLYMVLAEDTPAIIALGINGVADSLCNSKATCDTFLAGFPVIGTNIADSLLVTLGGAENSQALPAGTDVTFTTNNGAILSGAESAIGYTASPSTFYMLLGPDTTPSYDSVTDFLSVNIKIGDNGNTYNLRTVNIDDTGSAVAPSTILLGTDVTGSFVDGELDIVTPALSAGGSTVINANIVDSITGLPDTTANTVTFTSACAAAGTASFDNTSIITITGDVTVTYTSSTCSGPDVITATSGTATASGTATIAPASAGSIQFTSASSSLIALQGTGNTSGLPESSDIIFTVVDGGGNFTANEWVDFTLDSSVGGITLTSATGQTDALGQVTATVQSGTVATSVRVTATVQLDPTLITTSSAIVIATGPPDQDSMSLSASVLNPRGWNWDGTDVTLTARLADRFNNKIQDGTAILFTTELGSIVGSCTTTDGSCFTTWTSQSPRTSLTDLSDLGRTTIIATVEGEESFIDVDGNGVFSDGDIFTDLPEAYRDDDESGTYDSGETFTDFDSGGTWNNISGTYNGSGCTHTTLCDPTTNSITVRDSLTLVMAEDTPAIVAIGTNGFSNNICSSQADCSINYPGSFELVQGTPVSSATFTIAGASNEQVLPVASTINFSATFGEITAGGSHTVPNTNANPATGSSITQYTVYLKYDDAATGPSVLNINTTVASMVFGFPPIDLGATLPTYAVSGNVTGTAFASGSLNLLNNGGDAITVTDVGAFAFPAALLDGDDYAVTVVNNTTPLTCVVTGGGAADGTGTIAAADVIDIDVNCQ